MAAFEVRRYNADHPGAVAYEAAVKEREIARFFAMNADAVCVAPGCNAAGKQITGAAAGRGLCRFHLEEIRFARRGREQVERWIAEYKPQGTLAL